MHMHTTIKNNTITYKGIQIIYCLNHRYINEFCSFFLFIYLFILSYLILFFGYTHEFTLFYWVFLLVVYSFRLFDFYTTLTRLEIKKIFRYIGHVTQNYITIRI